MMRKILIVDDDTKICTLLSDILKEHHFQVAVSNTTEEGWEKLIHGSPDLILLDIEVPVKGGLEFCREVKEKEPYKHIPIIFLTVRGQEMDKIAALNLGGDDFITKPFSPKELLARIQVAFRRSSLLHLTSSTYSSAGLSIDFDKRSIQINHRDIHLTPKELDIFRLLYNNRNRVMTDQEIFDNVWGSHCNSMPATVYTHINRLRKKLKEHGYKIKTIAGAGYRFDERKLRDASD